MRLTSEQVRQGLLHDDQEVRQRCLHYFTDQWSSDESVMSVVVQVIDARGRDAFRFFHYIDQLTQSDETIEWVVQSLMKMPNIFDNPDKRDFRPDILSHAKGGLLLRHRDDVLSVLSGKHRESVERRMQFLSESPAALWDRMEALAKQHEFVEEWQDFPQDEMDDLVSCVAELGSVPIERMMELLSIDVPGDDESFVMWLEPKLVRLAGLIRHGPVLPILLGKLRIDGDFLHEACDEALVRLGTDEVVRTVAERFPDEEWTWQLFASSVFEHIHSDEAVRAATALLQIESLDESIRQKIAHGLACQFSTEGLQTLGAYLDSHTDWLDDTEWSETLPMMRVAAQLLQVDEPRLKIWQADMDEALRTGRASLFRNMPNWRAAINEDFETEADTETFNDEEDFRPPPPLETVMYESPRVGRNDPCPCGSGKKFKKCCLNKVPQD